MSVCMYEIATEGFIVKPREGDCVSLMVKTDYQQLNSVLFSRVIWEHETYPEASAISLKNATLWLKRC